VLDWLKRLGADEHQLFHPIEWMRGVV